MSEPICAAANDSRRLIEYWLDELDEAESARLEEHLFDCAVCTTELERLVALGDAIRKLHEAGRVAAIVPTAFVRKLKDAGLRVREYRLAPQASAYCSISPRDDFVVGYLEAPLEGVARLDAILEDVDSNSIRRLADIPFNSADGEVVLLPSASELRPLEQRTLRVHVVAIEAAGERTLGTYTFNHRKSVA